MKMLLQILIISFLISNSVYAHNQHQNRDKTFDAGQVNNNSDNLPPGLQKKSKPHGLLKKNKTPHGWSQGKKKGWHKN